MPIHGYFLLARVKLIQDDCIVFNFPVSHLLICYRRVMLIIVEIGLLDRYLDTGFDIVETLVESWPQLWLISANSGRAHTACARVIAGVRGVEERILSTSVRIRGRGGLLFLFLDFDCRE